MDVRLQNKTLPVVVGSLLDAEQKEIYDITLELKGNKPYLWDDIYTGGGGSYDPGSDYTIPGEALSDPAFAALISKAEKYLGWPYVWGGSSPSTSFDCSGFVCWVYTASGPASPARRSVWLSTFKPSSKGKALAMSGGLACLNQPGFIWQIKLFRHTNLM